MRNIIKYSFLATALFVGVSSTAQTGDSSTTKGTSYIDIVKKSNDEKIPETKGIGLNVRKYLNDKVPQKHFKEFQFLAFFINQGVSSNFHPESSLFNGQVVGRLFGENGSNTSDTKTSYYAEQRLIPFFIYQPKLFNGRAILRASFEIDWTWGDQAYGMSGNKGSAISADGVNIQTQNLELELIPAKNWAINLGLQRLYDTPYNPYRTFTDKLLNTGYRLAYWGTDAVGVSVRHDRDFSSYKLGYYKLYENLAQEDDDVTLGEFMYENSITPKWKVGFSSHWVRDRGKTAGGPSVFGQGLTSLLPGYSGLYEFELGTKDYEADVVWLGTYFNRNADYMLDRYFLSGFVNYNLGNVTALGTENKWGEETDIDLGGLAANIRMGYRYGQTSKDNINFEMLYTSGDKDNLKDQKFSGVMTGNYWGFPGSVFIGTGSYLIFPHSNVVNRYTPAVSDISNMGYGLLSGIVNVSKDVVPNKLNAKAGFVYAMSAINTENGGNLLGTEANVSLSYSFGPFMSLELHAAHMWIGDFYNSNDSSHGSDVNGKSNTTKPVDPWTAFIVFKWLMF